LRRATNFICLQYYIFTDDHIGHEIADILIERARAGVNVKVIYDHVGSFSVKNEFYKRMRRAGIDAQPFLRVTFPQLASRLNWRNHRKIVVIDGKVGYIGGMNIADRYVEEINGKSPWRDTHFRVRGAIINSLLYSFASDWSYMGRPLPTDERRFKPELVDNNVGIQLITSGPDSRWANIALAYQKAISGAKKSIFIQTPYFLPTDDLLKSLQAAALAQVDVRIMIPRHSDSYLLNWASFSYVAQCLQAGIKIYLYEERMIHSKMMVIDDAMVTAGSTNFDFRSFEHNFESNIFVYDRNFNTRMRDIFFKDLNQCTKLTYTRWRHRPFLQKVMESVVRLLSPIL
jgi:cardiolipin synthase